MGKAYVADRPDKAGSAKSIIVKLKAALDENLREYDRGLTTEKEFLVESFMAVGEAANELLVNMKVGRP